MSKEVLAEKKSFFSHALHRLLVWFYVALLLLIFSMCFATRCFAHTQGLEFRFYQIASISAALFFFCIACFERYHPFPKWWIRCLLFVCVGVYSFGLWQFQAICDVFADAFLFLIAVSLGLPFFAQASYRWYSTKSKSLGNTNEEPLWIWGFHGALIGFIGLSSAVGYIFGEFAPYSFADSLLHVGWFSLGVSILILGSMLATCFLRQKQSGNDTYPASKRWQYGKNAALFFFCAVLMFVFFQHEPDYYHCSPYLGTMHDVMHGKSLLYDTPSIYGYLSIHFSALWVDLIGFSFKGFYIYETLLRVFFSLGAMLIFVHLFQSSRAVVAGFILAVGLQLQCPEMDPSSGPLRFGVAMLLLFFLTMFSQKRFIFLGATLMASFAVFWSAETGVFIFPAWIFAYTTEVFLHKEVVLRVRLFRALQRGLFCIGTVALATAGIIFAEHRPGSVLPHLGHIYEYALMYTNVYDSGLIPAVGAYWFAIPLMLFPLALSFLLLVFAIPSRWYIPLSFVSIHNVAIFSYYVTQSGYERITHIAVFYFIAIALCLRVIHEEFKIPWHSIRLAVSPAFIVFCGFFALFAGVSIGQNLPDLPKDIQTRLFTKQNPSGNPASMEHILDRIEANFQVPLENVALLSFDNDTSLLIDTGVVNLLPLNPATMLFELPWEHILERYLHPALKKLPDEMVLITKPCPTTKENWEAYEHYATACEQMELCFSLLESHYEMKYLGRISCPEGQLAFYKLPLYSKWMSVYHLQRLQIGPSYES